MTLPVIQLPSDTHTFPDGQKLKYRGLSRAEALQIAALGRDAKAIEIHAISCGTEVTLEEAEQWVNATPQASVRGLFDAIIQISGLGEALGKDVDGGLPSEKSTV